MRLGTCVTNPATREPSVTASALATLDLISDGRMDLGIGRGDSARRVLGKPPTTMQTLEEAIELIRDLVEGRTRRLRRTPTCHFPWTGSWKLPVWVAGYGPMALAMTGRVADGLILQLADPDLISWLAGMLRDAAASAGRDPASIKIQAAAPAHVGPRRAGPRPGALVPGARQQPRRGPRQQVPPRAAAGVADGLHPDRTGYDYLHHAEVGSSNAGFVTDDVVDRFCIIGSAGGAHRAARRARGRRRRPVQPVPHERRRGGAARGIRPGHHPRGERSAGTLTRRSGDPATSWLRELDRTFIRRRRPVCGTMPAMRLPGRRGAAAAQRPMQFPPTIICPVCGLRNDITVRFCRNCGLPLGAPRDPVRGTTTKRADLPSDRGTGIAAIIGLLVVVGIVGVAGFLIFRGFQANAAATADREPRRRPVPSRLGALPAAHAGRIIRAEQLSRPCVRTAPGQSDGPPCQPTDHATSPASTPRPTRTPPRHRHPLGLDLQDGGHRRSAQGPLADLRAELEQGRHPRTG